MLHQLEVKDDEVEDNDGTWARQVYSNQHAPVVIPARSFLGQKCLSESRLCLFFKALLKALQFR